MCYHVKTEIQINGTAEEAWKTLLDFPSYPQWNPFIMSIEKVGEQELVAVMRTGNTDITFRPKILTQEANRELRWLGSLEE